MFETLKQLHKLTSGRPTLVRSDGVQVAMLGSHAVLFRSDADAQFYVQAYAAVPALLGIVEELERRVEALGQGALEEAQRRLLVVENENELLRTKTHTLEKRLAEEALARAQNSVRARLAARAAKGVRELKKHTAELQTALDIERSR